MKKRGFKMKSGNNPSFKEMGSSPMKGGFLDFAKKAVLGPVGALFGKKDSGDEGAQGVQGTIATDEQKAGLEGGQGGQLGKDANSKGKLKKIAQILSSDEGKTMGPNLQPSAFGKVTYAQAKAKDSNLDKYIAERKKYKAGSKEYETAQAKINAAYGTKRSEELKTAQIKKHKDDSSRKESTKKETTTTRKEYIPQTVSPRKEYDPASRNKRKEYIPQSQT